ncbi:MAG: DUF2334 domain-containing protein [Candidatus Scalindua sp.]|jgi:peptidoglycan/xylan/chitin deacetylase (PgdA/CDA1 family)|nr:DUF2334 domain-containing protein [Candidatus Scalindua sp.]MBT6228075.1 DUF2334 domain-containing protein [Candidatus Scalindua sp.]
MWQLEFLQKKIIKRALITLLVILFFSFNIDADGVTPEKQITVVFRFDDYSSLSSTEFEVKLINAFREYNAVCTFGIIPYVCTGDTHDTRTQEVVPLTLKKAAMLKNAIEENIMEAALHGYSHQTIRNKANGRYTEFAGLDLNSQVAKIAKGKNYLEKILDIKIATFIPPWNVYDTNTIWASEKLGLKCFSSSELVEAPESSIIKFAPSTYNLLQLRPTIELARRIPDKQPVIVVLFHEYDFLEIDKERGWLTYKKFQKLMAWITSQHDIHIMTVEQATVDNNMNVLRFNNNISFNKLTYLIPPFELFDNMYPPGVFLSSSTVNKMIHRCVMFLSLFYFSILLLTVIIAYFTGFIVFTFPRKVRLLSIYGGIVLFVFLAIHIVHGTVITYNDVIAIITFVGTCIGLLCCFFKLKRDIH